MEETLMDANASKAPKIKTHHARIVVDGTAEKPYYSIEWYDPTKNEYFLGYSSYYIGNVFNWLSECFEIVETEKTNADRIRAMSDEELAKECVRQFPMYLWPTDVRTIYFDFENHNKNNAINAWLEWLKQPADMRGEEDG